MDTIRAGRQGALAELDVVVLSDREDGAARGMRSGDRGHPVIGAGREVDDHPIDVGQGAIETGRRPDWDGDRISSANEIGQA
jgi:hypothetical protein